MHKFATVYDAMKKRAYGDQADFSNGLGIAGATAGTLGGTYIGKTIADTYKDLSPVKRLAIILSGAGLGGTAGWFGGTAIAHGWPKPQTTVYVDQPQPIVDPRAFRALSADTENRLDHTLDALSSYLTRKQ